MVACCRVCVFAGLCLVCAPSFSSAEPKTAEPVRQGPRSVNAADYGVGRLAPDLELPDVRGTLQHLSDLKDHAAVVIAFTCKGCPLCRKFAPTLARLERDYQKRNVRFVFVNPMVNEPSGEIDEAIRTHGFSGTYVRDRQGTIARALHATHSTDVIVLDARRTVIYRGAVDDQYGFGYALNAPRREYLIEALEATLKGGRPAVLATESPGCPLEVAKDKEISDAAPTAATFHNRISRLLQEHCVHCHREGGAGPFPLDNYDDVAAHAPAIAGVVKRGAMPPWFAAPSPPGEKSRWINDPTLPPQDKADLLAWLAAGYPAGDPTDAPLPRQFPDGWQIGTPDVIIQLPEPVAVKATGAMPYVEVIVPTGLTSDKWIQALEIRPTAPQVVHHVLIYALPPSTSTEKPQNNEASIDQTEANLQRGYFAAYVPGNSTTVLPENFAKFLPAGSRLRFQIHYVPGGEAVTDQTRLGMTFATQRPSHIVQVKAAGTARLAIPPETDNHPEIAFFRTKADMRIMAFLPHMHLRGKAFRYEAVLPDGRQQVLLDVPRYDTNWQLAYRLREPIELPKGTTIKATGWFDNSSNNPANPDPTRTVPFGPQIEDEMLIGYMEFYQTKPGSPPADGTSKPGRTGRRKR